MELGNSGGWNFGVEVSTNLATWDYVGPALPYLEFHDPDGTNGVPRYYRLTWP